jgi:hypothetical protein
MASTDSISALSKFIGAGFRYNLQTFPDTLTAAAFLFAILFQSPPFAALTASIVVLNVVRSPFSRFLSQFMGDVAIPSTDASRCSGHFPGVSFERILELSSTGRFGDLDAQGLPSYYSMFLGFLAAYIGVLPLVYQKEISYSPKRAASTTTGLVILGFVVAIGIVYRILSVCETPTSMFVGLFGGAVVGLACVSFLAMISERRLTNILSFPLIRNKTTDGKPIYVCEKVAKQKDGRENRRPNQG